MSLALFTTHTHLSSLLPPPQQFHQKQTPPPPSPRVLAKRAYLTLPRQVEFFKAAPVQRDQEVGARVAVGEGEPGGGHFFSRGGGSGAGVWWGPGVVVSVFVTAGGGRGEGGCGGLLPCFSPTPWACPMVSVAVMATVTAFSMVG